ncbi:MAG: DNA N-6-adenine-methyltransferase, partial [Nitrososphaeraceae archaeon]|nr:DNA N-6-adenine-methyltransferase [Nitrososphaeraceae archaeon]
KTNFFSKGRFITKKDDSLAAHCSWTKLIGKGLGWLNPEYQDILPWIYKARRTGEEGGKLLVLSPGGIATNWYRDHVHKKAMVLALNGAVQFEDDNGIRKQNYPTSLIISMFGFGFSGFDVWSWKDNYQPTYFYPSPAKTNY